MKPEAIDAELAALVASAREAWPGVTVSDEDFIAYLTPRLRGDVPPAEALLRVRAADLYLVAGCVSGNREALATFEARYVGEMNRAVEQANLPGVAAADIVQSVCERLFVSRAGKPQHLTLYDGRGDLGGWLRVVAVREALLFARRDRVQEKRGKKALAELVEDDADPELAYLKQLYSDPFRIAFERAMSMLDSRERNLLRYHYLDALSLERVAALYEVHRATAARWLASAREHLLAETEGQLRVELRVSDAEFSSLVRLLRSQLDLSVRTLLR